MSLYVLVGEGSFSYSARLVEHLREFESSTPALVHCTGWDSRSSVLSKYPEGVSNLRILESKKRNYCQNITVRVSFNVNAVAPSTYPTDSFPSDRIDVMFHHPHLGREGVNKESGGLIMHFLHAFCSIYGESPSEKDKHNIFAHVTLVQGQFERWGVTTEYINKNSDSDGHDNNDANVDNDDNHQNNENKNKNNVSKNKKPKLVMLGRRPFLPPPSSNNSTSSSTDFFRRGASGRAFANSRTFDNKNGCGSETITFGFESGTIDDSFLLPWEKINGKSESNNGRSSGGGDNENNELPYMCETCGKSFREARSLKSHMTNSSCNSNSSKTSVDEIACRYCEKVFKSTEARDQHCFAKQVVITSGFDSVNLGSSPSWSIFFASWVKVT